MNKIYTFLGVLALFFAIVSCAGLTLNDRLSSKFIPIDLFLRLNQFKTYIDKDIDVVKYDSIFVNDSIIKINVSFPAEFKLKQQAYSYQSYSLRNSMHNYICRDSVFIFNRGFDVNRLFFRNEPEISNIGFGIVNVKILKFRTETYLFMEGINTNTNTSQDINLSVLFDISDGVNPRVLYSNYGINKNVYLGDFDRDGIIDLVEVSKVTTPDTGKLFRLQKNTFNLDKSKFFVHKMIRDTIYIDLKRSKWFVK